MKLKQLPEDFQVEEINEIKPVKEKQDYKIYVLEKTGIETFSLLRYLSRQNNIPIKDFGIAGLKDKHAVTSQYFTIPSKYEIKKLEEKNFKITFLGYAKEKIKLGDLKGNRFKITVRDINKGELDGIYQKSKNISQIGVPNYFDSQRFGSVSNNEFIVKYLLKKDYEKAVKIFLTACTRNENKIVKGEKRKILQNWNSLEKIKIQRIELKNVVEQYLKTKNWLSAYKKISQNLREMFISAYQSYLWNECIKELLRETVNSKMYSIEYNIGSLLFYKNLSEQELKDIPKTFKTISPEIQMNEVEEKIISKILSREKLEIKDFDIKKETENFFKTHEREVILKPEDFKILEHKLDELNDKGKKNKFKIELEFSLPKGSYATIVTKRLFNQ